MVLGLRWGMYHGRGALLRYGRGRGAGCARVLLQTKGVAALGECHVLWVEVGRWRGERVGGGELLAAGGQGNVICVDWGLGMRGHRVRALRAGIDIGEGGGGDAGSEHVCAFMEESRARLRWCCTWVRSVMLCLGKGGGVAGVFDGGLDEWLVHEVIDAADFGG